MPDPTTIDEYNARYAANNRYSGYGFDTRVHMPCPFCAEPDWIEYPIIETSASLARGAVCSSCKRGAQMVLQRTASGMSFELVQTEGPDAPPYLPHIRRVDAKTD